MKKEVVEDSIDSVFTSEVSAPNHPNTPVVAPKSILSDADKIVGSKKPSVKSQSSISSYSAIQETPIIPDEIVPDMKMRSDSFQEPFTLGSKPNSKTVRFS